jgi:hypothetical protein
MNISAISVLLVCNVCYVTCRKIINTHLPKKPNKRNHLAAIGLSEDNDIVRPYP